MQQLANKKVRSPTIDRPHHRANTHLHCFHLDGHSFSFLTFSTASLLGLPKCCSHTQTHSRAQVSLQKALKQANVRSRLLQQQQRVTLPTIAITYKITSCFRMQPCTPDRQPPRFSPCRRIITTQKTIKQLERADRKKQKEVQLLKSRSNKQVSAIQNKCRFNKQGFSRHID